MSIVLDFHGKKPHSSGNEKLHEQMLYSLDKLKLNFAANICDLCGSEETRPVCSVVFLGNKFSFVRCAKCGLIYQNPVLEQESLNHIYDSLEYWEHKHTENSDPTMLNYYSYLDDADLRKRNAEIRKNWIKQYIPGNARILDIGCSDGLFVHVLSESGYSASGIDISSAMTDYARNTYGVDARQADFEQKWPFTEQFDAITCFATMSNFFHPSVIFNNIRQHLRAGGYFFFNFGDSDRLLSRMFGKRLYLYRPTAGTIYSKKTVINYCQKHELRIHEIFNDVQVISLARLLGFFRIPGSLKAIKHMGLEDAAVKMKWLTGYSACAVRCGQM